jgi:hypothetical protein
MRVCVCVLAALPACLRACPQLRRGVSVLPALQPSGGAVGAPLRPTPTAATALALVRFATARGLATGRQPRALAAAALHIAAEGAAIRGLTLPEVALAMHASADTAMMRSAELRTALISFATCLPWAADVTARTLHMHLPFLLTAVAATRHEEGAGGGGGCGSDEDDEGGAAGPQPPPSFVRNEAERARMRAKVDAARARMAGGAGAVLALAAPLQAGALVTTTTTAALALAPLPVVPPAPRGAKRMRPLGGKTRPSRKGMGSKTRAAALPDDNDDDADATAAAAAAAPPPPELEAEDEEVERLLRAGVSEVRVRLLHACVASRCSVSS